VSIRAQAKYEMKRAGFEPGEMEVMGKILDLFFDTWDSGGAVFVAADVLRRLIAGQPLSPLTGADDEWADVGEATGRPMWQNMRDSSVFKDEGGRCYDIDTKGRPTIAFPYTPPSYGPPDPVMVINMKGEK